MPRALLIIIALPLLLIVLAAVLVPILVDKEQILGIASEQLEAQTGARLTVGGDVGLSFFPTLGIALQDAALTFPGEQEPDVLVDALAIGVAVGPLLSGKIEISAINVDGLKATVRQSADPEAVEPPAQLPDEIPPADQPQESPGAEAPTGTPAGDSSAPPLSIAELTISNSRVTLVDPAGETTTVSLPDFVARNVNLNGAAMTLAGSVNIPEQNLTLELDGPLRIFLAEERIELDGLGLTVSGPTPDPLTVQIEGPVEIGSPKADLQISLDSGDASGEITLNYADPGSDKPITLTTQGEVSNLAVGPLLALADVELGLSGMARANWNLSAAGPVNQALAGTIKGPVELELSEASFEGKPLSVRVDGDINMLQELADVSLDAALGEVTAKGTVRYAGTASPQIDARLAMNLLDPALLALAGPDAVEHAAEVEPVESTGDEPLPLEPLRAIDTRAVITVDEARYDNYSAQNVALKVRAVDGVIRVNSFTGEAYGGKLDMVATFNAAEDNAKLNTRGSIGGVQIAEVLSALETEPMLEGKANLDWQVISRGSTVNELIGGLSGPITLRANRSVLKGTGIEKELCKAVALVNQQQMSVALPDDSTFSKLGIDIKMRDGTAILKPVSAQLDHAGVTGEGTVDILTQKFRLDFAAKLSSTLGELDPACRVNERLTAIDWPLECRGNLAGEASDWCGVATDEIIADLAKNEARRKIEKEAGRALEKLFKR